MKRIYNHSVHFRNPEGFEIFELNTPVTARWHKNLRSEQSPTLFFMRWIGHEVFFDTEQALVLDEVCKLSKLFPEKIVIYNFKDEKNPIWSCVRFRNGKVTWKCLNTKSVGMDTKKEFEKWLKKGSC